MNLADKIVMRPITALIPYASNARTLSEEFLGFLAENIGEARILMLATYRPGYVRRGSTNLMPERCRCSLSAGVPSAVVTDAPHFQQQYASEKYRFWQRRLFL